MGRFISLRRNRRDQRGALYALGMANAVQVVSVAADISNLAIVITFNKNVQNLPTWAAGMLSLSNNGVDRADTGWSLTAVNQITVTTAATMVVGTMIVTFLPPSSDIGFVGGGSAAGLVSGGGVVA